MIGFLDETSTFEQVLEAIGAGQVFWFSDVPERHQNSESAKAWLKKILGYATADPDQYFQQIPKKCYTVGLLNFAAMFGCLVLKGTDPNELGDYRAVACSAVNANRYNIQHVDPAFRDEEMLSHIYKCYNARMHQLIPVVDWLFDAMSDVMLEICCEGNFFFALEAPAHRMKDGVSRYLHLSRLSGTNIVKIRSQGRLDLISLKLKEEKWPFPLFREKGEIMPIEPESMEMLLERLEKSDPNTPCETIYMACMMREPIDQVVPLMASHRLKKLLIEMYPREALTPFMKKDVGLRGALLEEAIGL